MRLNRPTCLYQVHFGGGEEAQGRRSTILLQQSSCQLKFEGAVLIEYAVSEEPKVTACSAVPCPNGLCFCPVNLLVKSIWAFSHRAAMIFSFPFQENQHVTHIDRFTWQYVNSIVDDT